MSPDGLTWGEFAERRPDLAEAGRVILYQYGVGLAFLATVRPDGGPRVHPFSPVLDGQGLFAFLVPSHKRNDLHRDGRYAMHTFPADENEDAFYLRGTARHVTDRGVSNRLRQRFASERPNVDPADLSEQELFEFEIDRCLLTRTQGHGDPTPEHSVWNAQPPAGSGRSESSRSDSQARKIDR